jgi:hypothetical protein
MHVRVEQAAVVDEFGDAVVADPVGRCRVADRGGRVEPAAPSVVVLAGHGLGQHRRKLSAEAVPEASVLPAQERLVERYDQQPGPQRRFVGRDLGQVVGYQERQMGGGNSMKSWRIFRARIVPPQVRRLTAATSGRRPSTVSWQVADPAQVELAGEVSAFAGHAPQILTVLGTLSRFVSGI